MSEFSLARRLMGSQRNINGEGAEDAASVVYMTAASSSSGGEVLLVENAEALAGDDGSVTVVQADDPFEDLPYEDGGWFIYDEEEGLPDEDEDSSTALENVDYTDGDGADEDVSGLILEVIEGQFEVGDECDEDEEPVEAASGGAFYAPALCDVAAGETVAVMLVGGEPVVVGKAGGLDAATLATQALEEAAAAVVSVYEEWAVSYSPEEAPEDGWSQQVPAWADGMHMWRRAVTEYGDGSLEYGEPACLTGAQGPQGEDAAVLRIDSSRGTAFKNNEVSTVLSVVIYRGSQRITDAVAMRAVFGITARLEWSWQRMGDDLFGSISADDSRLSREGFDLALDPDDVDSKATFMCQLVID